MCGIVGYIGKRDAGPILMDCLKRLEYRGYDSAGVGVIQEDRIELRRSAGKIAELERVLGQRPLHGSTGIAHTRWATHGRPSAANAHPHSDCASSVAVVHNGIIENHRPLRRALESQGHRFGSQTDTEVIPHLIESRQGEIEAATQEAVRELEGDYALAIISRRDPGKLVAVRSGGPPLIVGFAPDGFFLTSDASAILPYTRDVLSLEEGEMAVLSGDGVRLATFDGRVVDRSPFRVPWDAETAQKGGFPHFMLKEIWEQPRAIRDTWAGRADFETGDVRLADLGLEADALARVRRIVLVACGTSWHASLVGKHVLESVCKVPVEVDVASEYRYRSPIVDPETLTVAISQSGETADTLGAVRESRARGSKVVAICNVVGSTLARDADGVLYTHAGPEIGVASTKAFTSQLVALDLLAIRLGRARGVLSADSARGLLRELADIPRLAGELLARAEGLLEIASTLRTSTSALYLGRGIQYPLALEGALKLKEISYIHAEGYPAGEMKHGPIALIDRAVPVVAIAPQGRLYEKTLSNVEEVKARDGRVIAIASEDDREIAGKADHVFRLPRTSELLLPILTALPLQLLAYHAAVLRGCDVDQPRNLAKSVTVE
jgi:glutamine---fructose-6-phosphate transaminase (isomerizing)